MSNNERMDRARRIRQMREGNRDETDEPTAESDDREADERVPDDDGPSDGEDEQQADGTEQAANAETEDAEPAPETADAESDAKVDEVDGTTVDADPSDVSDSGTEPETAETEMSVSTGGSVNAPLPDEEQLEAALDGTDGDDSPEQVEPTGVEESTETDKSAAYTETEEQTRVLEFTLDDEHYCLDIEYIEEIVKQETITRVPNTPEYVEGVVDLRGQITTILNPKVTVGKENDEASELIVVFDDDAFDDQGYLGWVVDDVRQVSPVTDSQVNDPPIDQEHVNGVIDREDDDQFVIWTTPELALADEE
ncbi:chemotaxis protein CheW [Halovenus marina]|uniref:chemotaxis protein CheW n=1 Tax=Halovenus marina TaxID=3396621 RepID=UPI003F56D015